MCIVCKSSFLLISCFYNLFLLSTRIIQAPKKKAATKTKKTTKKPAAKKTAKKPVAKKTKKTAKK